MGAAQAAALDIQQEGAWIRGLDGIGGYFRGDNAYHRGCYSGHWGYGEYPGGYSQGLIMENQMEKNMSNELEPVVIKCFILIRVSRN